MVADNYNLLKELKEPKKRRLSTVDRKMQDILRRALSNPQGMEKEELFRTLTDSTLPFSPQHRQFALDTLGPDTRATKLGDPYKNKEVLGLFAQFNPGDLYFKALLAGLGGK
jgi:hypothetical protein